MSKVRFAKAYIRSMRLYYAFITGIAGWIGVSFYYWHRPDLLVWWRSALILVMLFLSWGVNQIINDYLGLPEDRINAPNRPMVTGELHPGWAMGTSIALLLVVALVSWWLNPWSVVPLVLGVLLNVLYEFAKAWSLWGNVVFGLSIGMCTVYGFLAGGPLITPLVSTNRISAFLLVALMNGLMTFYTYFKDLEGGPPRRETHLCGAPWTSCLSLGRPRGRIPADPRLRPLPFHRMAAAGRCALPAGLPLLCRHHGLPPDLDCGALLPSSGGRTHLLQPGHQRPGLRGRPDHHHRHLQRNTGPLSAHGQLYVHRLSLQPLQGRQSMRNRACRTGGAKVLLYVRIALHVVGRYGVRPGAFGWNPIRYGAFLGRALRLLLAFRHDKPMRTHQGWKLNLYVPAYPSAAFFHTIEAKLLFRPPGPTTVVYSMTKACRYKCPHCYQRNDKGADVDEDLLLATARRLQDMGVALFDIEGGEPFIRFDRLLALVRGAGRALRDLGQHDGRRG